MVSVLWQNGTTESIRATDLIPYLTIDEYDVWSVDLFENESMRLIIL